MKYKTLTQKAITVRFPISEFSQIEELAEQNNSNLAEVLRDSWRNFKQQNDYSRDLKLLEERLLKHTFNICCAVAGLSQSEKKEALEELKQIIKGEQNE